MAAPVAAALIWGIHSAQTINPGKAAAAPAFKLVSEREIVGLEQATGADNPLRAALPGAMAAADGAPLSSYPFAVRALTAQRLGRRAEAERLMLRALRLEPRSTAVRAWLLNRYLQDGRFTDGLDQAAALYAMNSYYEQLLSKLLATVSQAPEARRMILDRFRGTPHLAAIARAGPAAGLDRRAAIELLAGAGGVPPAALAQVRSMLLGEYLKARDYRGAYAVWARFLPAQGAAKAGQFYDGGFAGLPGPAPFNWTLTANEHVLAETVRSGMASPATALRVTQFASHPVAAARQSVLLAPGRHRLSYLLKSDNPGAAAAPFAWTVECDGVENALARFPIAVARGSWTRRAETFEVPASCPLVTIQFGSTRAEFNNQASVTITSVRLDRL